MTAMTTATPPSTATSPPAATSSPTAIHGFVEHCRAGTHPALVARLPSGWVLMAERQVLAGYCLLLPDPVVPHLNALSGELRTQFLSDMARVGDALLAVTGALRINYAMFGNVEVALHAHLFPRFADESDAARITQPFALDWNAALSFSVERFGDLRRRLETALECGPP